MQSLIWHLLQACPSDDEEFFDDVDNRSVAASNVESERDDAYEIRPASLEPLPTDNDKRYPQEDRHYFSNKKYVRTDELPLLRMLYADVKLPSLLSAFTTKKSIMKN